MFKSNCFVQRDDPHPVQIYLSFRTGPFDQIRSLFELHHQEYLPLLLLLLPYQLA